MTKANRAGWTAKPRTICVNHTTKTQWIRHEQVERKKVCALDFKGYDSKSIKERTLLRQRVKYAMKGILYNAKPGASSL